MAASMVAMLDYHDPDAHSSSGDRELDAAQGHATDLLLNRLPSTSRTATRDSTAALGRPPRDCLHATVFDRSTEVTTTASASVGSGYYGSSPTPFLGFTSSAGSTATSASTVPSPSTTEHPALKVFAEMPTPSSWHGAHGMASEYWNHCYVHQSPIQSSCEQRGSTNLREQYLDGIPQPYGFHNLNRRSLSLADGNQRSYYALPENYSLQLATSSMSPATSTIEVSDSYQSFPPPVNDLVSEKQTHLSQKSQSTLDILAQVKAKVEAINEKLKNETVGHSCEMILDRTEQKAASEPLLTRETINEFNEMPIYDVYDETEDCLNESVDVQQLYDEEQTICGLEKLNDNENLSLAKQDNDQLLQCFSNVQETEQTSADVLDYTFEKQQQNDEKASGNVQQLRDPQLNALVIHERRKEWDPGAAAILVTPLNPTSVAAQVAHLTLVLCSKVDITAGSESLLVPNLQLSMKVQDAPHVFKGTPVYDIYEEEDSASLNITSDVQDFTLALQQQDDERAYNCSDLKASDPVVTWSSQLSIEHSMRELSLQWDPGIDLFSYKKMHLVSWIPHSAILLLQQLHNKIISSMWEFSLGKGRQVQWDPGIKLLLYELWWLQSLSKRTEYALGHLLSVKFFIETAAIMCCSLPKLIQQRRNVAVVLYSWRSIFHDMHYHQIFQKCKAMSSELYWHEDIKFIGIALWLITFNPP